MKFQLKAIAAALALAVTLPAHAAIDKGISGNGSLVLTLLDRIGTISATFDLGKNYSDFSVSPNVASNTAVNGGFLPSGVDAPGTSFSWNLTQGDYAAAWTSFLSVGTLANTTWGVLAGDILGSGTGGRGYITTASAAGSPINTAFVSTDGANLDTYLTQVNAEGNHPAVANGGSTAIAGQGYAGSAVIAADGALSGKGPITMGAVGADLKVIQVSTFGTSITQANQYTFANNAHFNLSSTGLLTYSTVAAPVPEADTWAMMFMGLGLMGFIARRKQS